MHEETTGSSGSQAADTDDLDIPTPTAVCPTRIPINMKTLNILGNDSSRPRGRPASAAAARPTRLSRRSPSLNKRCGRWASSPFWKRGRSRSTPSRGCHPNPTGSGLPGARLKTGSARALARAPAARPVAARRAGHWKWERKPSRPFRKR